MFKLIGYWTAPSKADELDQFEELYLNRHCPTAAKIPGLRKLVTMRTGEGLEGSDINNFRIAELYFDDRAAYDAATETPEFTAMREDAGSLIEQFEGVSVVGENGDDLEHALGN